MNRDATLLLPQSVGPRRWGYIRPDGTWCEAKGGRWGPFLREGRFLVPPIYDDNGWEAGPFMSGWKNGDELMNWFDKSGRIVVPAPLAAGFSACAASGDVTASCATPNGVQPIGVQPAGALELAILSHGQHSSSPRPQVHLDSSREVREVR